MMSNSGLPTTLRYCEVAPPSFEGNALSAPPASASRSPPARARPLRAATATRSAVPRSRRRPAHVEAPAITLRPLLP